MSVRKWTEAQKQAIEARNGTLLISAAAGSGKTAVLVERVVGLISDENKPVDIDKLLIVTFTKAAANEMRERISNRLAKLIDDNPSDRYLQRQQLMLSKAKISTIHSFCSEIIRSNFQKLNVAADFRVADSNEMEVLRADALQFIIDDLYEENNDDFLILSKSFSRGRDDKLLLEVVEQLYDFVRSYPFMEDWFEEKLKLFEVNNLKSLSENIFVKSVFAHAEEIIDFCIEQSMYSLNQMRMDDKIYDAYNEAISFDLKLLKQIKSKLSTLNWDDVENSIDNFKRSIMKLKALRGYANDPLKISITNSRDQVKKAMESLKKIFMCNSSELCDDMNRLYPIVAKLFEAVKRFSKKLDELKLEKKLVDFSDLEQMTLKLLIEKDGNNLKKTEDAERISKEFYEIMVDEYQDTNETQDMIFRSISRDEKNLFMVGDVKQSIYRFRQAMPEIFLSKKQSYKYYSDKDPSEMSKINLDKNFRSRRSILDTVNFMFSMLMSNEIGDLEYNDEETLKFGATYSSQARKPRN